jgi:DNA-binding HxlR family transcriptional regulator
VHKISSEIELEALENPEEALDVRGYGQFCPVARGAEIFGERWTPLIVRELLGGSRTFSDLLQGVPRIPRSMLCQRLASLERHGVIERRPKRGGGHEYLLTPAGEGLRPVIQALGGWGHKWVARSIREDDLDPDLLMWFLRRRVRVNNLPEDRIVLEFQLDGRRGPHYWLVLQRPEVDLCFSDPGFEIDLVVTATSRALARVYLGLLPLTEALRNSDVSVAGSSTYRRAFKDWIGISQFAESA